MECLLLSVSGGELGLLLTLADKRILGALHEVSRSVSGAARGPRCARCCLRSKSD